MTFTFTLTATTPGSVAWTATTTADGPVSSVGAVTPVVTVQPKAVLTATPSTSWASVCPGGLYQYTLTVGNAAAAAQATGVTPTFSLAGTSAGSSFTGPVPASANIAGGASQAFVWDVTAGGVGTVLTTASVTGQDINAGWNVGAPLPLGAASATVPVLSNAVLAVTVGAPVSGTLSVGQANQVTVRVSNTGGYDATLTGLALGDAGAGGTFGVQSPGLPVTVTQTGVAVFTVAYTPVGAGPVTFSATADGTSCGALPSTLGSRTILAEPAASLSGTVYLSATTLVVGQILTITLDVQNTGGADAAGVTPNVTLLGTAGASLVSGPVPATAALAGSGGAAVSFVWTYQVTTAGTLNVSAAAAGTDGNSLAAAGTGAVAAGSTVQVISPAALQIVSLAVARAPSAPVGGLLLATLTVSNPGNLTATVYAVVVSEVMTSAGMVSPRSILSPPLPRVLAAGAST
ncbi:MAG: hypothetical protein AAB368_00225, partial [bacterium]